MKLKTSRFSIGLAIAIASVLIAASPPVIALERDVGIQANEEMQLTRNPAYDGDTSALEGLAQDWTAAIGTQVVVSEIVSDVLAAKHHGAAMTENIASLTTSASAALGVKAIPIGTTADLIAMADHASHKEGGDASGACT